MPRVEISTQPTVEPVNLEQLKGELRVSGDEFDADITRILTASRRHVEHDCQRSLNTQTVKLHLDKFPVERQVMLRRPPVLSVTSVTYVDTDGASQTLAASTYHTALIETPQFIQLKTNESWPDTETNTPNAVTIECQAGYGASGSDVPEEIRQAVIRMAQLMWDGCDMCSSDALYMRLINAARWTFQYDTTT